MNEVKYLGLILENKLTWSLHLRCTMEKVNESLMAVRSHGKNLTIKISYDEIHLHLDYTTYNEL